MPDAVMSVSESNLKMEGCIFTGFETFAADGHGHTPKKSSAVEWLCWQFADSAFPTGGFAHSGGLEAAWQHQEIRSSGELESSLRASLMQVGRGMLPFMTAVFDDPDSLSEMDHLCDAFLTNHVANRASKLQGRALLASASRIFTQTALQDFESPVCGHLPPIFGAVTRMLDFERGQAGRLFLFWHLRGLLASAVRLGIVGPIEAQRIQFNLGNYSEEVVHRFEHLPVNGAAQTAPLLDLWQGAQDRLYSRLFQS